jgi:hypothetical protein
VPDTKRGVHIKQQAHLQRDNNLNQNETELLLQPRSCKTCETLLLLLLWINARCTQLLLQHSHPLPQYLNLACRVTGSCTFAVDRRSGGGGIRRTGAGANLT